MTSLRVSLPLNKPYVDNEAIDYYDEENSTSALTSEFSFERPVAQWPKTPEMSPRNLKATNIREQPPKATIIMPRIDPFHLNTIYGNKPVQQVIAKNDD